MSYSLYCSDCLYVNNIKHPNLIITDAPNNNTLSTEEVILRLEKFHPETFVICKDEVITLDSGIQLIQRDHAAFGGNLFEKAKFAAWYIRRYTEVGDVVLDPFCGYSSTGIAAIGLKRSYIGIDTKPEAIQESERILNGCS